MLTKAYLLLFILTVISLISFGLGAKKLKQKRTPLKLVRKQKFSLPLSSKGHKNSKGIEGFNVFGLGVKLPGTDSFDKYADEYYRDMLDQQESDKKKPRACLDFDPITGQCRNIDESTMVRKKCKKKSKHNNGIQLLKMKKKGTLLLKLPKKPVFLRTQKKKRKTVVIVLKNKYSQRFNGEEEKNKIIISGKTVVFNEENLKSPSRFIHRYKNARLIKRLVPKGYKTQNVEFDHKFGTLFKPLFQVSENE